MGASKHVLEVISGWPAVELLLKCVFFGILQVIQISVKRLWKGHRKKRKNNQQVELTIDSSIGTHCYIKILGVKYHYVETGPKSGELVIILGDAPDSGNLWCPTWTNVVRRLAEAGYHVITLDLRGTGGSEGGSRRDLSPPRAVEELATLMNALNVSSARPAAVIGFGIGGMLAWYLAHCHGNLIYKLAVIGAPHPNLYWQYPPAQFCNGALHFIQWPILPERWLAEGEIQNEGKWSSSRACDWNGALNYVRGAAWFRIQPRTPIAAPTLLVGPQHSAAQLVSSATYCLTSTLRLVSSPEPQDKGLASVLLDFLIGKEKESLEEVPRTLVSRMLGAVAGRSRELLSSQRLVLQPAQA